MMKYSKGITLIEMVTVMAIATVLMATSILAVSQMTQQLKNASWRDTQDTERQRIRHMVEADFRHATQYRTLEDNLGFELETLYQINPQTEAVRHLPTIVRYSIIKIEDYSVLVRRQAPIKIGNQNTSNSATQRIVSINIEAVTLTPQVETDIVTQEWNDISSPITIRITSGQEDSSWEWIINK